MGFLLHIQPDSVDNERKEFLGSTKDVVGRSEYFASRDLEVRHYVCDGRSDEAALRFLVDTDLSDCEAVVFEYETYLKSLIYLKDKHPSVRRVVRAHNSNFPHFLDQYRGRVRMLIDGVSSKHDEGVADFRLALDRFRMDCQCAELADFILSISDWETKWYWSELTDPRKVFTVPYFLPINYGSQISVGIKKHNLFVCFMGTGGVMTPLLYDAGKNTIDLIARLPEEIAKDWDFCITGRLRPLNIFGPLGRVISTGRLPSPFPILAEARVVSILSDLGMGFKTKILEAIESGCWVMMPNNLYQRLPNSVRAWCISVDMTDPKALANALSRCLESPPLGSPNQALRTQAFSALDAVFADSLKRASRLANVHAAGSSNSGANTSKMQKSIPSKIPVYFGSAFEKGKDIWDLTIAPILSHQSFLPPKPHIFEYGVGIGQVLHAAMEAGHLCGGVDASDSLLKRCRQLIPEVGRLGAVGPNGICDFPSLWADFAYSYNSVKDMAYLSQVSRAFSEISRVLKPGGCFAFRYRSTARHHPEQKWFKHELLLHREEKTIYFRLDSLRNLNKNLPKLPYLRVGVYEHSKWFGIPFSYHTMRGLLSKAGFKVVDTWLDKSESGKVHWVTCRKLGNSN